jgi:hypothetical protein
MNVLIVGKAKTGTTVISKSIEHSLKDVRYYLEPLDIKFAYGKNFSGHPNNVVKILYEGWAARPNLLAALVHNETAAKFDRIVGIARDPRDQLISLIHFYVDTVVWKQGLDRDKLERWVAVLARKERDPAALSMMSVIAQFKEIYGIDIFKISLQTRRYLKFLQQHRQCMHVLKYEEFMTGNLAGLEEYLGFTLSANRDVGRFDHTPRSRSFNNWKRYMLPSDVDVVREAYAEFMSALDYDDWELAPTAQLDPETGSAYTRKTAERRFAIMEGKLQETAGGD